jgi:acetoin utilization protein AcuB
MRLEEQRFWARVCSTIHSMLVQDWMTPAPLTVSKETPVLEAMRLLKERGFRRLPVVDGAKLIGIVTDKDLKDAMPSKATTLSVWELNYLLAKLTVQEVMVAPVKTCRSTDTLETAALTMQAAKVAGLPVLDAAGALIGMLTITDVLGALIQVMGLKEGGTRLTVELPDQPGSLERAARAVQPANIVSVATVGHANGSRQLVIRALGDTSEGIAARLREAGIGVLAVQ